MFRLGVSIFIASAVSALYSDERGKNDWSVESIGEVVDVAFLPRQQSFMLSDDNLLTFFKRTQEPEPTWRKQLPTSHPSERYYLH
jgi:hypothetical protein